MRVKEIMASPPVTVREDQTLAEVAKTMWDKHVGCALVVDDRDHLVGIITETDFTARDTAIPFSMVHAPQLFGEWIGKEGIERIYQAARSKKARDVMTKRVATVGADETIESAVSQMIKFDVNRIPVVREGVPIGVVARHDLLRLLVEEPGRAARSS